MCDYSFIVTILDRLVQQETYFPSPKRLEPNGSQALPKVDRIAVDQRDLQQHTARIDLLAI